MRWLQKEMARLSGGLMRWRIFARVPACVVLAAILPLRTRDGKADLRRKRHAVRYAVYLVGLPILGMLLWKGGVARLFGLAGLLAGTVAYFGRPWQRLHALSTRLTRAERWASYLLPPLIRLVGDLAKMAGYPPGLLWRWRNRARKEIYWRRLLGKTDALTD